MTIDIEKLIADIDEDGSGEIEYDEFRNLLSSTDWNSELPKGSRLGKVLHMQHFDNLLLFL